MSHATVTLWTCDRCSRRVEGDSSQPHGWRLLTEDREGRAWEVCQSCFLLVERLLQPVDRPDNGYTAPAIGYTRPDNATVERASDASGLSPAYPLQPRGQAPSGALSTAVQDRAHQSGASSRSGHG